MSITKHGKDRFVVMSQEHFERLTHGNNPRRAMLWSELPEDEMATLNKAVDAYLEE